MASNSRQKSVSSASRNNAGRRAPSNNPRYAAAGRPQAGPSRKASGRGAGYVASGPYGASSGRNPGVSSVRLGDIDQADRAASRREGGRRVFVVLGVIVALACALVVGGLLLGNSSVFAIKNVEVTGAEHLTEAELNALAPIPEGTTLFNVDAEMLERSIERDAWVQDVTIKRKLPSTLEIVVTERGIGAVVEVTSPDAKTIQPWAISADGMWLMAIPDQESEVGQGISQQIYADAEAVLHITNVPYGLTPEIGSYCSDENVNNALAIVDGMTTELADQVKVVSATDAESTLLTLDSGVEIAFGTADNIRDKERICLEIMEQNPGRVAYINVRVANRPTWRSV